MGFSFTGITVLSDEFFENIREKRKFDQEMYLIKTNRQNIHKATKVVKKFKNRKLYTRGILQGRIRKNG